MSLAGPASGLETGGQSSGSPAALRGRASAFLEEARAAICQTVRGKPEVVELALIAVAAGGHVLVEDVPGVGKTTLARAVARALGGTLSRVQFTSDLLPGDITGVTVLDPSGGFSFRQGPVFANVLLADEINRAGPKTQSALLEAMSERRVTVDGASHPLPSPFLVLATQNPLDFHGTFPLPDSQLDRFLVRLSMGYPALEHERAILRSGGARRAELAPALRLEQVREIVEAVELVDVHEEVEDYLLRIVRQTREDPRFLRGVSTRGAEALYRASRARALLHGRGFVIPEDVYELVLPVLAHRLIPRAEGERPGVAARTALLGLLEDTRPPG
jgi:MoxR-like ATPase